MPYRCIIKSKDQYKVSSYKNFHGDDMPMESVLVEKENRVFNTYELTNELKVKFKEHENLHSSPDICEFSFENSVFKTIKKEDFNLQTIVGYLNKYNQLSESEIKKLANQAQQKSKPILQLEIEELNTEIEVLKDKIEIYAQIDEQYDKIKELLSKL